MLGSPHLACTLPYDAIRVGGGADAGPVHSAPSRFPISSPAHSPSAPRIKFGGDEAFQKAIKACVERYFAVTGKKPRDCPQMYIKATVLLTWLAVSYVGLLLFASTWWIALPLAASLGFAVASIGFSVQHDGGHKAFSEKRWVNRLAATTLDLLGGSSFLWDHKHNSLHHTYANIAEHDDDINVGFLGRFSPQQRRLWFHRAQHFYMWLLYGFLPIKWQLMDDFRDVIRGRIGNYPFERPRGWALAIFILGKVVFFSLAFVIPSLLYPIWAVALFYFIVFWINGLVLSVVFQLAHVVEEAEFPVPDATTGRMPTAWAMHQVQTTVNFARGNPVLTWFLGGLNFQIEHHLFPRISHIHYPRISRLLERVCERHGVRYNAHPTLLGAIGSHFRWLRAMGRRPELASGPAA